MSKIQDLPDELVLKILRNSETKDLISCGQVSQRIRKISHDSSLWVKANLEKKIVKTELLEMLLSKGCKTLNISNSTIVGSLNSNIKSQLRDLDLNQSTLAWVGPCTENIEVIEELLFLCHSLKNLEMEGLLLTPKMAVSICKNGKTLQKLNLNYSFVDESRYPHIYHADEYGLDHPALKCMQEIIKWCPELKEFDLNTITLNNDNLEFLLENIPPDIEKLNLMSSLILDPQIEMLLSRCNKIKALSLQAQFITDGSLTKIGQYLNLTLEELSLGYYFKFLTFTSFVGLKSMPRLKILNLYCRKKKCEIYNGSKNQEIQKLRLHLPHLKINMVLN